jgi:hypothetical protein
LLTVRVADWRLAKVEVAVVFLGVFLPVLRERVESKPSYTSTLSSYRGDQAYRK